MGDAPSTAFALFEFAFFAFFGLGLFGFAAFAFGVRFAFEFFFFFFFFFFFCFFFGLRFAEQEGGAGHGDEPPAHRADLRRACGRRAGAEERDQEQRAEQRHDSGGGVRADAFRRCLHRLEIGAGGTPL